MMWAILLFLLVMLVHVFASSAPLNPWLYPYYLVTLVFPSTVFMLGLSFFVLSAMRRAFVSIIILFASAWATVSLSGESLGGILNFSGLTLPNEYSEITGFAAVVPYLSQRLGWLLVGVGLFFFSILFCKRLENRSGERRVIGRRACVILLLGVSCLVAVQGIYTQKYARRTRFAEVYNRHVNHDKLYLLSQELDVTPDGCRLKGLSRMRLLNDGEDTLSDFLLYLNPGLEVKSLKVSGINTSFRRDNQVIVVERSVSAGDTIRVEIEYEGGIDEEVFYLDVQEKELKDTWSHLRDLCLCPPGKRYAYLEDSQVLLNPEGLWYPVTVPPVNPASPYIVEKNFTDYKLIVHGVKDRTVISQGERHCLGESVVFHNNYPLPGISLCIGDYERRYLRVGSIDYELFLFRGHGIFVEGYEDVLDALPGYISDELETSLEYDFGKKYPFKRLLLIETPGTFATYYRNQRGASEYVQPEIVYFPERFSLSWKDRWTLNRESKEQAGNFLGGEKGMKLYEIGFIVLNYLRAESRVMRHSSLRSGLGRLTFCPLESKSGNNLFSIGSLYTDYVYYFHSLDYPVMETILNSLARSSFKPGGTYSYTVGNYRKGIRFLNTRSLEEAFLSPGIGSALMRRLVILKTDELFSLFNLQGVSANELTKFLREYTSRKNFCRIDLKELNLDMKGTLGTDFMDILPGWYYQNRLPVFVIKDIETRRTCTTENIYDFKNYITQFIFTIYNDSDTDGIVTLSYNPQLVTGTFRDYVYRIPAREGKKIVRTVHGRCFDPVLKLGLSQNYPSEFPLEEFLVPSSLIDTTSHDEKVYKEDVFSPEEIVVDNTDPGFSYNMPELSFIKRWKRKRQEQVAAEKDIVFFDKLNFDWQIRINETAYGTPARTAIARQVTNSGDKVSWSAKIDREGYYEVSVYFPPGLIKYTGSHVKSANTAGASFSQYYTIERNGKLKESSIEISGQPGWVSIGRFYCTPGMIRVSLLDKGIFGQLIWADAVKWRYLGDKNE
ncbi:hypothetical protein [Gabonibacter chumensis]|uniref:hypothetical protein n=1 Tax=Gabonibacter chumensis TaxID=2972474 RepID=UPI002573A047|nr:hypothetical protein [Gabonibacter chumensis]MCR9010775.1 hypothetical protein [Gabonibacter chumensis]